jgi:hypothetical protein
MILLFAAESPASGTYLLINKAIALGYLSANTHNLKLTI